MNRGPVLPAASTTDGARAVYGGRDVAAVAGRVAAVQHLQVASAAIVAGHPSELLAAACFSVNGFLLCLSAWAVWAYVAANQQLLAEDADFRILKGIAKIWLYVAIGFGVALIAGYISIYLEYALWVLWSPPISIWWGREKKSLRRSICIDRTHECSCAILKQP